ncbi:unnamed protein product [Spirodela intermedia]|uniref:Uncharacterized protein n=1 Tax=Spirodela intermedia TaxID=51605 RepID=A0A7I8KGC4_SPIIN|nr:unnamed protein product [Spirodela intermedia]
MARNRRTRHEFWCLGVQAAGREIPGERGFDGDNSQMSMNTPTSLQ